MKLGPVTKLKRRYKTTSKKFDDSVMSANCDIIVVLFNLWLVWSNLETEFQKHSP